MAATRKPTVRPTPAELACADPDQSLPDRELPHRRPATAAGRLAHLRAGLARQAGLIGQRREPASGAPGCSTRSTSTTSSRWRRRSQGRGFFQNAGDTLRQGVEAGPRYTETAAHGLCELRLRHRHLPDARWSLPPPTIRSGVPCSARSRRHVRQRSARATGCPACPSTASRPASTTGSRRSGSSAPICVAASNQIFFGDEGNDNAPLAGYAKVDLHTSYDVTQHVQLYGLINNLFDSHYGLFGNYFDLARPTRRAPPPTASATTSSPTRARSRRRRRSRPMAACGSSIEPARLAACVKKRRSAIR